MGDPVFELVAVEKRYFDFVAVRGVSLRLNQGEVLGLVGENGAGKSTLLNLMAGITEPSAGEMKLGKDPYRPRSPAEATSAGIALVHQELNLFSNLSIAENLFLGDLPTRGSMPFRWIDRGTLRRRAAEALQMVGLAADPMTLVARLSPGERQLVEIAKALTANPKVLLLDEPTTSLAHREADQLFALIDRLKSGGMSILYVSHNLEDVCRLSQRIVVLRDGEVQATGPATQFSTRQLISLMVGRTIEAQYPAPGNRAIGEVALEVRGLGRTGVAESISFAVHRQEVVGIAGLMGAGRTEVARMIFGLDSYDEGVVRVGGAPLAKSSPRTSVARGMAFLTENRREEGLLPDEGVMANIALASLDRFARGPFRFVAGQRLEQACGRLVAELSIACRSQQLQPVKTLSGGNQQKVVLSRWLLRNADVLILDEPTRGIDVGARQQVYEQIQAAATRGAAVLMISSEIEELMGMCDRILVLSAGVIRLEAWRESFDRDTLMSAAFSEVQ